ncbi:MAG: hypothetical protein ED558_16490 [Oricola sp.]|nr:MAG: hypothetical protein ED558_16490 [Oricola sp.]
MVEALFRAPPHLAHLKHLQRYAERVSRESTSVGEDLAELEAAANSFGAVWARLMVSCRIEPGFAERMDKAIGEVLGDPDATMPLTITEALARVQEGDDRKADFRVLLRMTPSSLAEARAQCSYVIDTHDTGAVDLTKRDLLDLIRSIAAPPWLSRIHEIDSASS